MSRTTADLRRPIGLCLLAAAFALTGTTAIAAASGGQSKKLDPPTSLWKSYPLERRPSTTEARPRGGQETARRAQAEARILRRRVSRQTSAHRDEFPTPMLTTAFILLLTSAVVVLMRRSMPVRGGTARRMRDGAQIGLPALPASVKGPRWRPRRPQQPQELLSEAVREPYGQAPQSPAHHSDADVLEALRREKGDPLVEEREEADAGPSSERQLGLELRTFIDDIHLVSLPERSPQTHEESRAARQQTPRDRLEPPAEDPDDDGTA